MQIQEKTLSTVKFDAKKQKKNFLAKLFNYLSIDLYQFSGAENAGLHYDYNCWSVDQKTGRLLVVLI